MWTNIGVEICWILYRTSIGQTDGNLIAYHYHASECSLVRSSSKLVVVNNLLQPQNGFANSIVR